jgi:hypothetical protein
MMTMASTTPRFGPVSRTVASARMIVGKDRTASKSITSMLSSQRGP